VKRFALFFCLLPTLVQASPSAAPSPAAGIAQMVVGLGVILAVLYGALHMLRRLQQGGNAGTSNLKVISATSVGPRERVVLVAAGKRVMVLGVAPGRVNMLHLLDEGEVPLPAAPAAPPMQDFALRLKQFMERGRK